MMLPAEVGSSFVGVAMDGVCEELTATLADAGNAVEDSGDDCHGFGTYLLQVY